MINYHKEVVNALKTILPTHYEMSLHSGIATPCISYMELDNSDDATGDTLGYSRLQFQIIVWGNNIGALQSYAVEIDNKLRPLGFKRIGSNEMYDSESAMIQKILSYEALAFEYYNKEE